MFIPTHIIGGLLIGKITGNYIPALIGATLIDLDHVVVYAKYGLLLKLKKILCIAFNKEHLDEYQRGFFHSIFALVPICFISFLINFDFALSFSLGYACHLLFDASDNADFYPFFPWKKINPVRSLYETLNTMFFNIGRHSFQQQTTRHSDSNGVNLHGPIKYFSKQEFIFALILFVLWVV